MAVDGSPEHAGVRGAAARCAWAAGVTVRLCCVLRCLQVVRYVGDTDARPGVWVGVELDRPLGCNDGSAMGKRYFTCAQGHGLFVRPSAVRWRAAAAVRRPLLTTARTLQLCDEADVLSSALADAAPLAEAGQVAAEETAGSASATDEVLFCQYAQRCVPVCVCVRAHVLMTHACVATSRTAHLFAFVRQANQWQDRSSGHAFVLRHRVTKQVRVLVQSKAGSALANHVISGGMRLEGNVSSDRAWVYRAMGACAAARPQCLLRHACAHRGPPPHSRRLCERRAEG